MSTTRNGGDRNGSSGDEPPPGASGPGPGSSLHELLGSASVFASVLSTRVSEALSRVWGDAGLTLGQLRFLTLIAADDEPNVSDVARCLDLSHAAVSRSVDRLVDRGLVRRRQGTRDRRTVRLALTGAGRAVVQGHRDRVMRAIEDRLRWVPAGELAAMTATLDRMSAALLEGRTDADSIPCDGCRACNLFRREDCPLGRGRSDTACHPRPATRRPRAAPV